MKIALYDPYLNIVGGGERYVCTLAEFLSRDHDVDIFWDNKSVKGKIEEILKIDLSRVNIIPNIFSRTTLVKRISFLKKYDRLFFLSDGSIPWVSAGKNYLHFQFPVAGIKGKTFLNNIKLKQFSSVICNSQYTKKYIDRSYGLDSAVVYPPVDVEKISPLKKESIILSVGRFTRTMHNKNQDVLIKAFKKLCDKGNNGWQFVLAGGVSNDELLVLENLKNKIGNYPIKIYPNLAFAELINLYGKASVFWHAAGLNVDVEKNPENVEHFGIATVEAMAGGCVPIVANSGGQGEIITEGNSGLFFNSEEDLIKKTEKLLADKLLMDRLSVAAINRSKDFSKQKFCEKISDLMAIK